MQHRPCCVEVGVVEEKKLHRAQLHPGSDILPCADKQRWGVLRPLPPETAEQEDRSVVRIGEVSPYATGQSSLQIAVLFRTLQQGPFATVEPVLPGQQVLC